jgi:hypothetical protein
VTAGVPVGGKLRQRRIREEIVSRIRRDISSPDFKLDSQLLAERLVVIAGPTLFASPGARINVRCSRSDSTTADSLPSEGLRWLLNGAAKRRIH